LILSHPREAFWVDASTTGLSPARLDALPWERAFKAMATLEAGDIANPDEGRQVGHYWLRAAEDAPTMGQARAIGETLDAIRDLASRVRRGELLAEDGLPWTDVIHVGIGGSALGPALLVDALAPDPDEETRRRPLRIHVVDNTDPDGIARLLAQIGDLAHALVVVVSKSGGTLETRNGTLLVAEALHRVGLRLPPRAIAITVPGSALDQQAVEEGWLATFPMWEWVGGRFSLTSAVGLLPAELAGIDSGRFLDGAREMDAWTRTPQWRENPAALMAGVWYALGDGVGDRNLAFIPYRDRLVLLSRYLQQLVMESIGKEKDLEGRVVHQGLTVYGNKGSTDQHAYVQQLRDGRNDTIVTFVQSLDDGRGSSLEVLPQGTAGDALQGFLLGTRRALSQTHRPSLTITIPRVDPWSVGALVALFERTVGLYAGLVNINAYHQPGVEAGKKAASDILELSRRIRKALSTREAHDIPSLARAVSGDPVEVWSVVEHLVATGRATREGPPARGRYRG
jgi:glucose-6-phosphate isomerase